MSGGSFDYLYTQWPHDATQLRDLLLGMAEYLQQNGHTLPAMETFRLYQLFDQAIDEFAKTTSELNEVWRVAECVASLDSGPDELAAAVAEYQRRLSDLTGKRIEFIQESRRRRDE